MFIKLPVALFVGVATLFSNAALADAIAELKAFYANTQSLRTEFRQLQIDEAGTVSQTLEGRFWMARPQRLRWVYERPYRQEMINDGERFWLYDEDLAQVTVRPTQEALKNAPLLLLSGGPALDEQFEITSLSEAQGMYWVQISPRDEEGDFISARMGLKKGIPSVLELQDSLGQQTRILFMNLQINPRIDPAQFRFTVPEGVEVIGADTAG